jgi:phosphate transport system substrate-binding protein
VTTAAAAVAAKLPANTDYRISIENAAGKGAYPISSFTFLLVYKTQPDPAKGKKLVDFLRWYLRNGEKSAASLDYAPLPVSMIAQLEKRLGTIQVAPR